MAKKCYEELEDMNPCSPTVGRKVYSEIPCPEDFNCKDVTEVDPKCVGVSTLPYYENVGDVYCINFELGETICIETKNYVLQDLNICIDVN